MITCAYPNTSSFKYLDQFVYSDTKFNCVGEKVIVKASDNLNLDHQLSNFLFDCSVFVSAFEIEKFEYNVRESMIYLFTFNEPKAFANIPLGFAFGSQNSKALRDCLFTRNCNNLIN